MASENMSGIEEPVNKVMVGLFIARPPRRQRVRPRSAGDDVGEKGMLHDAEHAAGATLAPPLCLAPGVGTQGRRRQPISSWIRRLLLVSRSESTRVINT